MIKFKACLENGVILTWDEPQTWKHVFKAFKMFCNGEECLGVLYCGEKHIRTSGYQMTEQEPFWDYETMNDTCKYIN